MESSVEQFVRERDEIYCKERNWPPDAYTVKDYILDNQSAYTSEEISMKLFRENKIEIEPFEVERIIGQALNGK